MTKSKIKSKLKNSGSLIHGKFYELTTEKEVHKARKLGGTLSC